jgi:hypothetical protein
MPSKSNAIEWRNEIINRSRRPPSSDEPLTGGYVRLAGQTVQSPGSVRELSDGLS